jgi:hypothetical protein
MMMKFAWLRATIGRSNARASGDGWDIGGPRWELQNVHNGELA